MHVEGTRLIQLENLALTQGLGQSDRAGFRVPSVMGRLFKIGAPSVLLVERGNTDCAAGCGHHVASPAEAAGEGGGGAAPSTAGSRPASPAEVAIHLL